jgi:hypothetical protein
MDDAFGGEYLAARVGIAVPHLHPAPIELFRAVGLGHDGIAPFRRHEVRPAWVDLH